MHILGLNSFPPKKCPGIFGEPRTHIQVYKQLSISVNDVMVIPVPWKIKLSKPAKAGRNMLPLPGKA